MGRAHTPVIRRDSSSMSIICREQAFSEREEARFALTLLWYRRPSRVELPKPCRVNMTPYMQVRVGAVKRNSQTRSSSPRTER